MAIGVPHREHGGFSNTSSRNHSYCLIQARYLREIICVLPSSQGLRSGEFSRFCHRRLTNELQEAREHFLMYTTYVGSKGLLSGEVSMALFW